MKNKPKKQLEIVSRRSVSPDGTWLKRDKVVFTSKTSMTNNRADIDHHRYQVPHLTLKEGSKVKSDPTKRFGAHDFLKVVFTSKTCTTNNKGDIDHQRYQGPHSTLKEGSKVKSDPPKDLGHMISYRLSSHPKPLRPITREI